MKFFRRKSLPKVEIKQDPIDLEQIDRSFQLLRTTTAEVSTAAVEASKILQRRLTDSEQRYSWTVDSLEDLVLIKDPLGRWKTLNLSGQRILGINHNDYYNKTDADIILLYPHLTQILTYCQVTDRLAWNSGAFVRSEEKIPNLDTNSFYYIDTIKHPTYNEDGTAKELIIVGRDVTDIFFRTKREKACFQALNSASDAIVILDNKADIFFCNDQFIETFNLKSYDSVVNKYITDVIDIPLFDQMWDTVQQNETWSVKCTQIQRMLAVVPMMNGQPKPIFHICTFKPLA